MAWTTPKTDWTTGELVSAEDMNAIGENLATLQQFLGNIAVYTTPVYMDWASAQFADVDSDNLNLTIATTRGNVLVHFSGSVWLHNGEKVYFDIDVDGTRQGDREGISRIENGTGGNYMGNISFTHLIQNLSAGSHTFKLQSKTVGGIRLYAGAQFWVREI